jgi:hypothetical protein
MSTCDISTPTYMFRLVCVLYLTMTLFLSDGTITDRGTATPPNEFQLAGRNTYLNVDLDAIFHNIQQLLKLCPKTTGLYDYT